MSDETIPRDLAEMTTKNLDLAGRVLQEILADPDILDEIPDGATVVPMPFDDRELAEHNLALATAHGEAGKNVVLWRVDVPEPDVPAWRSTEIRAFSTHFFKPHWPQTVVPEPGDLLIVYDRDRDVLLVDFFGGKREAVGLPFKPLVALRVDPANDEVVGYLLSGFLEVMAQREPRLVTTIRRAELRAITPEEFANLEPPEAPPAGGTGSEEEKAKGLVNIVSELIA